MKKRGNCLNIFFVSQNISEIFNVEFIKGYMIFVKDDNVNNNQQLLSITFSCISCICQYKLYLFINILYILLQ